MVAFKAVKLFTFFSLINSMWTYYSSQPEVTWFHWTKWPCWRLFTWIQESLHTPPSSSSRFRSHVDAPKRCLAKTNLSRFCQKRCRVNAAPMILSSKVPQSNSTVAWKSQRQRVKSRLKSRNHGSLGYYLLRLHRHMPQAYKITGICSWRTMITVTPLSSEPQQNKERQSDRIIRGRVKRTHSRRCERHHRFLQDTHKEKSHQF